MGDEGGGAEGGGGGAGGDGGERVTSSEFDALTKGIWTPLWLTFRLSVPLPLGRKSTML